MLAPPFFHRYTSYINYCFKEVIFDGFGENSWEFFLEFLGRILGCALKCRIKAGTECVLSTERSKRRYLT